MTDLIQGTSAFNAAPSAFNADTSNFDATALDSLRGLRNGLRREQSQVAMSGKVETVLCDVAFLALLLDSKS